MNLLIAFIHYPPFCLYNSNYINSPNIGVFIGGQNYHFFSFITILIEIVPSDLHSHNNLSDGSSSQVLPATLNPQQHFFWSFQLVDVPHEVGTAAGGSGRRHCLENSHFSRMTALCSGEMEIAVAPRHRPSHVVLTVEHYCHLGPAFWVFHLIGHLEGHIPDEAAIAVPRVLANSCILAVGKLPPLIGGGGVDEGERMGVVRIGALEDALVVNEHRLLLLDLRHELQLGGLISQLLALLALLLFPLLLAHRVLLAHLQLLHLKANIQMEEERGREEESLNMRARGLNANDVFSSKERIVEFREQLSEEALRSEGFEITDRGIPFRKIEAQGKAIGYQILHRDRQELESVRTGADYLSEALRTIALEARDIISDLIQLQKYLKAKEFQDLNAVIS